MLSAKGEVDAYTFDASSPTAGLAVTIANTDDLYTRIQKSMAASLEMSGGETNSAIIRLRNLIKMKNNKYFCAAGNVTILEPDFNFDALQAQLAAASAGAGDGAGTQLGEAAASSASNASSSAAAFSAASMPTK